MKKYFLLLILVFIMGCTTNTNTDKVEESKIYSLKEYIDIFSSCSSKTITANAKVIEKTKCSCSDDSTISCDCYIFNCGGTFSLGDEKGVIEYYNYCTQNEIWKIVEEGNDYLFTIELGPNYINPTNVQPYNYKFPSIRETIEQYNQQCKEKTYRVKATVIEKEVCLPPAVEGTVFKCDKEDKLVIESGGLKEEFNSVNKNVLKKVSEGQEYIFVLKKNSIIDI